ncbi:MAG: hypothetical protein ACFFER_09010 [Candidatus Thorarchaeota archaeon]
MELRRLAAVMLLISCLLVPVLAISPDFSTYSVQKRYSPSEVIWSEDFNDIADWDFWGLHYEDNIPLPANYSVSEGMLRFQGGANHWTVAMHNTTQSVGTWSFDLDVQDQYRHLFHIAFIGGYWDNDSIIWPDWRSSVPYEYGIMPVTSQVYSYADEFVLYWRPTGGADSIYTLDHYRPAEMIGWHHIDITRNSSGHIDVYFNGELRMSAEDTHFNVTECFKIYSQGGPAIDNIEINDKIMPPQPQIDPFIIAVIVGGALVALVVIVIIIRRRP